MPSPFTVQAVSGSRATGVASIDAQGNEKIAGTMEVGKALVLDANSAAMMQTPMALTLYSPDGMSLNAISGAGITGIPISGGASIGGNLAVAGTTALGGRETISGSDAGGLLNITNAVATTTATGTVALTEAAAANNALGASVSGDTQGRWVVSASGQISWGPGNAVADTVLARSAAGLLSVTTGSFTVTTAGQGLRVKEGANAKQGTSVLVAGTVVVANTSVTANSRIFLTSQADGGTPGFLRVSARTAGTSFTITSAMITDTSTVAWQIFEPA
jgi:hypothetical protein